MKPWEKYASGPWSKYAAPQGSVSVKVTSGGVEIPPVGTESPEMSLSKFGGNVLSSGMRMAEDIGSAVIHPVDTVKAVGNLALGAAEKAIPGEQDAEQNVDALVQMYVDRYGGIENLRKTLYEDPVGVLADVATLAGGAGLAAKGVGIAAKTAGLAKTAQAAGKVAQVAGTVSEVTDPMRYATRAAGVLVPKGLPEKWYQSALKPSLSQKNLPKIAGQVATGLENAVPVSEGGIKKLVDSIKDLRTKVNAKVAAAKGIEIDPLKVVDRLNETILKFQGQPLPASDLRDIGRARLQWLNRYAIKDAAGRIIGYRQIPIEEAQRMKVGGNVFNRKKYGELSAATAEAEKALTRGLKEELEAAIPELKGLNAEEGAKIELAKQIRRAVGRKGNWERFAPGIYGSLGGISAGMATGSADVGVAVGALLTVLRDPTVKSKLAIAINRARSINPGKWGKPGYATALSRIQEYEDALASYAATSPIAQGPE